MEASLPATTVTRPQTCDSGTGAQRSSVQNLHNAQGQRVIKTVSGDINTAVHFIYNQAGQVIAEIDATTGTTLREYVYVNGQQMAIVDDTGSANEATYFVHNDHLGTPQKITDVAQAVVWDATYQPFGEAEVTVAQIKNNIRFPGQYADEETGLHYNYFRDYDPSLGRYVESDPIGLGGGMNTFSYVNGNAIGSYDPLGLIAICNRFWAGSTHNTYISDRTTEKSRRFWSPKMGSNPGEQLSPGVGIDFQNRMLKPSVDLIFEIWRVRLITRLTEHFQVTEIGTKWQIVCQDTIKDKCGKETPFTTINYDTETHRTETFLGSETERYMVWDQKLGSFGMGI